MKKTILISAVVLFTAVAFSACGNKATKTEDATEQVVASNKTYVCPMHPEIVSDSAGVCPICKMNLVESTEMVGDTTHMHSHMSMDSVK